MTNIPSMSDYAMAKKEQDKKIEFPSMGEILRQAIEEDISPIMYKLGEEKIVIICDYGNVERIIQKEYGFKEFSVVASEEKGNDCTMECTVDGIVDSYEEGDIKKKKEMYMVRTYMNDLARQGKIQKGTYMIDISW